MSLWMAVTERLRRAGLLVANGPLHPVGRVRFPRATRLKLDREREGDSGALGESEREDLARLRG
jgi:hypothetical protein